MFDYSALLLDAMWLSGFCYLLYREANEAKESCLIIQELADECEALRAANERLTDLLKQQLGDN